MSPLKQPLETQPGQDTEPDPTNKAFHTMSDLVQAFKRTYFEGADGGYPGFEFGLPGLPHGGYTYLYALISIALATALIMLLYPLFMRHVFTVYSEENPEEEGECKEGEDNEDEDEDEAPETLMDEEAKESASKSPSKSKNRAKRSATPQPKRSSSRSSAASSKKASSSGSPSKKNK